MTPPVTIRTRDGAHDINRAALALVEVHGSDGYPVEGVADPHGWLTGGHVLQAWVADLDGDVVGHVAISEPRDDDAAAQMWVNTPEGAATHPAVLNRLFVTKRARGYAIGTQLLQTATEYAEAMGRRLVLDVMTKDTAAIRLYERLGWRRLGVTEHDSGHGLVPAFCYVGPAPSV